jgi:threonine/homoserine/homoserine lactone efflux protein
VTLGFFLKGLAFGFVLAATVGPMWILCFRRTVSDGRLIGLASGLGIAVADALYGAVAAFGLTAISGFLLEHSFWIGLAGAAFLVYLGATTLASNPVLEESRSASAGRSIPGAFLSTLALTLANPPTLLAFAAIFAGLGLASGSYVSAALVVAGVFAGSAVWWLILILAAGMLRGRIGPGLARGINTVSGLTILGFAGWQIALLLR